MYIPVYLILIRKFGFLLLKMMLLQLANTQFMQSSIGFTKHASPCRRSRSAL